MAKMNNNIVSKVGIAMVLFAWVSSVDSKIVGKIDLVIIAPSNTREDYMNAFKQSITDLPNHIEMGEDKARVAVVEPVHGGDSNTPGAQILFKMSSKKEELTKWVNSWTPTIWGHYLYHHSEAFKLIREKVFDFSSSSDKGRAKMIIQVLNGWPFDSDRPLAYEEAKKLREKGVFIYVTYDAKSAHLTQNAKHKTDAKMYVGELFPWRMIGSKHPDHKDMFTNALKDILNLGTEITRDLCTFCKYNDTNQAGCKPDKRPKGSPIDYFGDGNAQCENVNPVGIPCPPEECEFECNRQWPWDSISSRPCTDGKAMPCVDRHSRQPSNPPPGMETCLNGMKCNWTCPTTTTTTTTTTTVQPPTHKALPQQDNTTSKPDDSMPLYLIIVLAVIGVVVILVIVVVLIVVIVSRRSSAAKRKAMEDLVNAKKKRAEDREKHRHRGFGMDIKMGAQDNMGVSMVSTMETTKQGKLGAKSMASPKMGGGIPMASPNKKAGKSMVSPSMVKTRSKSPAGKK